MQNNILPELYFTVKNEFISFFFFSDFFVGVVVGYSTYLILSGAFFRCSFFLSLWPLYYCNLLCSSMTFTLVLVAGCYWWWCCRCAVVVAGTAWFKRDSILKLYNAEIGTHTKKREGERESLSHSFILWCNRKEFHAMCYCNKTTLLDFIWRCVVLCCIVCCYIFCSARQIFIYLNDRKMCVHCILTPLSG